MADINVNRVTHLIIGTDEITRGIESGSMYLQRTLVDGNLTFGRFCSSRFEMRLHGKEINEAEKQAVVVYQVTNPDTENEEIIDIFTGNIDSATFVPTGLQSINDTVYDIVMYDKSYFIRQKDCAAWWEYFWSVNNTATLKVLRESLLSYVGLFDNNTVIENEEIIIPKKPVEITRISFADMFEYITAISGTIPFIDGAGFVRYWNPSLADSHSFDNNVEKANSAFNKFSSALRIGCAEQLGADGTSIAIYEQEAEMGKISLKYNPILADVSADTLTDALEVIVGDYYNVDPTLSGNIKSIVCDPSVELGSLITVGTNKLLAIKINLSGPQLIEQEFVSDLLSSDSSEEVTSEFSPEFVYLSKQIQDTKEELEEQIEGIQVSEEYAEAVDTFNSSIAAATGLLSITVKQQDETIKKYFYAPSIDESLTPAQRNSIVNSNYIFTMTSNGFAWTNKWEGSADATTESHTDPITGQEVATTWNYGIDRNGNAILRSLTVNRLQSDQIAAGAITADKIQAGAITIGGLDQSVINFIEAQGGEDDGIDVHATAGTLSGNNYPLTTKEEVTELTDGQSVEITFPNGIDFTLNTSGSTYLYKPRTVSIGNNTYTLLNANGTTDWCNVKNSTDYASNTAVKYVVRTISNTSALCELIEAENVQSKVLEQGTYPNNIQLTEKLINPTPGIVLRCNTTGLTYGLGILQDGNDPSFYISPDFGFTGNSSMWLLSKSHYDREKGLADAYSVSDFYLTGVDPPDYEGWSGNGSSTVDKTVYISGFSLSDFVTVDVTFSSNNQAKYPTLNVSSTGAKDIVFWNGSAWQLLTTSSRFNWRDRETRRFTYDASNDFWRISMPPTYYTIKTEEEPTGVSSVNVIIENLRTSSGTELRAFELRYEPVSLAPSVIAIDEEAREAADRALLAALAAQSSVDDLDSDVDSRISSAIAGITVEGTITTFYGTSSTAAGTAAKAVSTDSSFALTKGAIINVNFTYANTADNPTLNVNSTGAKAIYVNNSRLRYGSSYATNAYNWTVNTVVQFMYDGSYWRMSQTSADLILAKWCAANDITKIDGGKIYTGSIAADSIAANAITAVKLAAGAVTAEKLSASNAMLANLLAKNATITGLLKIIMDQITSSSPGYSTELANARNSLASEYGYSSYAAAPSWVQTIINAQALILVSFRLMPKNSPLKLYVRSGSNELCTAALHPLGLTVATSDSAGIDSETDSRKIAYYGASANVPGELTLQNRPVHSYFEDNGSASFTIPANSSAVYSNAYTFSKPFDSIPFVLFTPVSSIAIRSISCHVNFINNRQFSFVVGISETIGIDTDVTVYWKAIGT